MMTLTKFGIRGWGTALILTAAIEAGCWYLVFRKGMTGIGWGIGIAAFIIFLALAAFFRNPCRKISKDPRELISPADGLVKDIEKVTDFTIPPFTGEAYRIGIFLSVFNVHVNRAPADLEVETNNYRKGEFLDARHPECGKRNEAQTIAGTANADGHRFPMAVRQISGAIARRIVCPVNPGRKLAKGEVYGMIKFGSRTELYLPCDRFDINIKVGDKVKGGSTVIATLKD